MHLTNNIPDYIETNSFRLLGVALLLIIISFIVALVQVILQSKKNLRLQKQYAEDMQRFTKLSKEKQSAETAPKDPVVSPAHPVLFGVCAFFILCGFTLALFSPPYEPQNMVTENIQSEAKRVYGLNITFEDASQLYSAGGDTNYISVLSKQAVKSDYIEFGSLATGVKKDGETKVLKITLVRIDGEYKLVYEGKAGLSSVQEIPKA